MSARFFTWRPLRSHIQSAVVTSIAMLIAAMPGCGLVTTVDAMPGCGLVTTVDAQVAQDHAAGGTLLDRGPNQVTDPQLAPNPDSGALFIPNITPKLILGELTSLTVRDVNDPSSGGRLVVDGKSITVPDRVLIGLPTGQVALRDLMLEAPADCRSQQPPQSGLGVLDSCRGDRPPALVRVVATTAGSGELVASVVMLQKDSGRTLARMRPQRGPRARSYGAQPADAAADPPGPETQPR